MTTAEFEDFKVQGATEEVVGKIIAGATVPKVIFRFTKSPILGVADGVGVGEVVDVDVGFGVGVGEGVEVGLEVGEGVTVGEGVGVGIGFAFTVTVVETVFD